MPCNPTPNRYGDRFWQIMRSQLVDSPMQASLMPEPVLAVPAPCAIPRSFPDRARRRKAELLRRQMRRALVLLCHKHLPDVGRFCMD
jgi:hypothetical protein